MHVHLKFYLLTTGPCDRPEKVKQFSLCPPSLQNAFSLVDLERLVPHLKDPCAYFSCYFCRCCKLQT